MKEESQLSSQGNGGAAPAATEEPAVPAGETDKRAESTRAPTRERKVDDVMSPPLQPRIIQASPPTKKKKKQVFNRNAHAHGTHKYKNVLCLHSQVI